MVSPTKMSRVQTSTLTITIKLYIYIYIKKIDKGVFGEAKPMKDDGTNSWPYKNRWSFQMTIQP